MKAFIAAEEVSQSPTGQDPWVMRNVKLKRGKYEGRNAYVLGKTSKKYQVQVEGVPYQLEFYATMFCLPEHYKEPKNARRKKKALEAMEAHGMEHLGDTCALGFGGVPAEVPGVLTGQVV